MIPIHPQARGHAAGTLSKSSRGVPELAFGGMLVAFPGVLPPGTSNWTGLFSLGVAPDPSHRDACLHLEAWTYDAYWLILGERRRGGECALQPRLSWGG
jgi:hypothetical protein